MRSPRPAASVTLALFLGSLGIASAASRPASKTTLTHASTASRPSVVKRTGPASLLGTVGGKNDTRRGLGKLADFVPQHATVELLGPKVFHEEAGAFAIHVERIDGSGAELPPAQIRSVLDQATKAIGPLGKNKVVFYPMSGFDAGTPLHLFPEATTIIGIDNHPFLPPGGGTTKVAYAPVGTHNFAYYGDIDRLGHVGPAILGALKSASPSFRIKQVSVIRTRELLANNRDGRFGKEADAVHAIVEFDGGPGTPLRRYIHVNASFSPEKDIASTWWWKGIDALGPQAVVIKASQSVFHPTLGAARDLRPAILGWLERSHGVLVEDRDRYVREHVAGFSELKRDPLAYPGDLAPQHPNARSTKVSWKGMRFGYSGEDVGVYVSKFGP